MGKRYLFLAFVLLAFCATVGFLAVPQVYAGEGYGNHYAGGNEDFNAGNLPPAGTNVFINYLVDYNVNTLEDNAGRHATAGPAGPGYSRTNFTLNTLVDALRYIKVTKIKVLGGDLIWHVIVPVGYQHVSLSAFGEYGPGSPSSKTGLGDIEPGMGIAWHCPTFSNVFAIDIVAPTGAYGSASGSGNSGRTYIADPANLGRNYWSIDPLWAFTYLGDKTSPIPGLELSAKLMYWINTVNTATSYVSGQEFDADYLVAYHFGKNWALGANGYILYQTTKDTQFGHTAFDPLTGLQTGVMGKEFSVGPAINYDFGKGCVTFKYQRDVYEQNRPEGDKFWLKFVWAF
ncbi:MAG: transporter [Syntrophorhabdales bacterium]|jgi:hypothetical protein